MRPNSKNMRSRESSLVPAGGDEKEIHAKVREGVPAQGKGAALEAHLDRKFERGSKIGLGAVFEVSVGSIVDSTRVPRCC